MALWSTDHDQYPDNVIADCVPSMLPLCKFRNISGPSEGNCKVRDLAYNSRDVVNYVSQSKYFHCLKFLAFGCFTNWYLCSHCSSMGLLHFSTGNISIPV